MSTCEDCGHRERDVVHSLKFRPMPNTISNAKEQLNLIYHGTPVSEQQKLFVEVRQWLEAMDTQSLLNRAREYTLHHVDCEILDTGRLGSPYGSPCECDGLIVWKEILRTLEP